MKKLLVFLLTAAMMLAAFSSFAAEETAAVEQQAEVVQESAEAEDAEVIGGADGPTAIYVDEEDTEASVEPDDGLVYPIEMVNTHGYFYGAQNSVTEEMLEEAGLLNAFKAKGEIYSASAIAYDFFEFGKVVTDGKTTAIKINIQAKDGEKINAASTYTVLENGRVIRLPNRFYFTNPEKTEGCVYISMPDKYLMYEPGDNPYYYTLIVFIDDGNEVREGAYSPQGFESLVTNGGAILWY